MCPRHGLGPARPPHCTARPRRPSPPPTSPSTAVRAPVADEREQHDLAEQLRAAADALTPGWLGGQLDARFEDTPLGGPDRARVRAHRHRAAARRRPLPGDRPAARHRAPDRRRRRPRSPGGRPAARRTAAPAGGRARRLAARPRRSTRPAAARCSRRSRRSPTPGLMPPPVDRPRRPAGRSGRGRAVGTSGAPGRRPATPAATARCCWSSRRMPELTEAADLARIARAGAARARGRPAPDRGGLAAAAADRRRPPSSRCRAPRRSRCATRTPWSATRRARTFADPPRRRAQRAGVPRRRPARPPVRRGSAASSPPSSRPPAGSRWPTCCPSETMDRASRRRGPRDHGRARRRHARCTLQFNDLTPHWMVGGRSGAGKTAFLVNVLYGLATRYGPDELTLYLLDFKEGVSFTEFVPTQRDRSWLPHARAVGVESDREYGLAVLRELDAEMSRRSGAYKRAGVTRFADLRAADGSRLPRIVCVIDEFQVLLAGTDPIGRRGGRAARVAGPQGPLVRHPPGPGQPDRARRRGAATPSATRSSASSRCGSRCRAAATCSSRPTTPRPACRWAPRSSTRPAGWAARAARPAGTSAPSGSPTRTPTGRRSSALRHRLWEARAADAAPPRVFAGYAHQHLDDDPTYRAALAGRSARPTALLGRDIDVALSTATFPLDTSPGRHLADPRAERRTAPRCWTRPPAGSPPTTRRVPRGSSSPRWSRRATSSPRRWPADLRRPAGGGDGRRGRPRPGADRRPARLPGRVRHGRDRPGRGARRPAARGAPRRPEPRRPPAVLVARPAPVHRGGRRQQRPRRRRRPACSSTCPQPTCR